jgi:hypothetical protein
VEGLVLGVGVAEALRENHSGGLLSLGLNVTIGSVATAEKPTDEAGVIFVDGHALLVARAKGPDGGLVLILGEDNGIWVASGAKLGLPEEHLLEIRVAIGIHPIGELSADFTREIVEEGH